MNLEVTIKWDKQRKLYSATAVWAQNSALWRVEALDAKFTRAIGRLKEALRLTLESEMSVVRELE